MKFTQLVNSILKTQVQEGNSLKDIFAGRQKQYEKDLKQQLPRIINDIHIFSKNSENEDIKKLGAQLAGPDVPGGKGLMHDYLELLSPTPPYKAPTTDEVTGGGRWGTD